MKRFALFACSLLLSISQFSFAQSDPFEFLLQYHKALESGSGLPDVEVEKSFVDQLAKTYSSDFKGKEGDFKIDLYFDALVGIYDRGLTVENVHIRWGYSPIYQMLFHKSVNYKDPKTLDKFFSDFASSSTRVCNVDCLQVLSRYKEKFKATHERLTQLLKNSVWKETEKFFESIEKRCEAVRSWMDAGELKSLPLPETMYKDAYGLTIESWYYQPEKRTKLLELYRNMRVVINDDLASKLFQRALFWHWDDRSKMPYKDRSNPFEVNVGEKEVPIQGDGELFKFMKEKNLFKQIGPKFIANPQASFGYTLTVVWEELKDTKPTADFPKGIKATFGFTTGRSHAELIGITNLILGEQKGADFVAWALMDGHPPRPHDIYWNGLQVEKQAIAMKHLQIKKYTEAEVDDALNKKERESYNQKINELDPQSLDFERRKFTLLNEMHFACFLHSYDYNKQIEMNMFSYFHSYQDVEVVEYFQTEKQAFEADYKKWSNEFGKVGGDIRARIIEDTKGEFPEHLERHSESEESFTRLSKSLNRNLDLIKAFPNDKNIEAWKTEAKKTFGTLEKYSLEAPDWSKALTLREIFFIEAGIKLETAHSSKYKAEKDIEAILQEFEKIEQRLLEVAPEVLGVGYRPIEKKSEVGTSKPKPKANPASSIPDAEEVTLRQGKAFREALDKYLDKRPDVKRRLELSVKADYRKDGKILDSTNTTDAKLLSTEVYQKLIGTLASSTKEALKKLLDPKLLEEMKVLEDWSELNFDQKQERMKIMFSKGKKIDIKL